MFLGLRFKTAILSDLILAWENPDPTVANIAWPYALSIEQP